MTQLIEHESHAYDSAKIWFFMDSISEYVASASWIKEETQNTPFNGPARIKITDKVLCAESDNLSAIQEWARLQIVNGAHYVNIHKTFIITKPERLAGKRDNYFIKRLEA